MLQDASQFLQPQLNPFGMFSLGYFTLLYFVNVR